MNKLGNSDIYVSEIGMGTFQIAGSSLWGERDEQESVYAIRMAKELGVTFFDTAPIYGFGRAERILGQALSEGRDKVIISSKFGLTEEQRGPFFSTFDGKALYNSLTRDSIVSELDLTLQNLHTDYLDIYILHRHLKDNPTKIAEVCETLLDLIKCGKIRRVGLSNVDAEQIEEYHKSLGDNLIMVQEYTNLLEHNVQPTLTRQCCEKNGISLVGINGLALGALSGKLKDDYNPVYGTEQYSSKWFHFGRLKKINSAIRKWDLLCEKYDCDASSLSLAYLLTKMGGMSSILVGSSNSKHMNANKRAMEIMLSDDDVSFMIDTVREIAEKDEETITMMSNRMEDLKIKKTPIIIWGAGLAAKKGDELFGISKCNLISIFDSDINKVGNELWGIKIDDKKNLNDSFDKNVVVIVAVPISKDDAIRELNGIGEWKDIIYLGDIRWL